MLRNRKRLGALRTAAIAAALCAPAVAMSAGYLAQMPQAAPPIAAGQSETPVERAAVRFVSAMASKDAATVWLYATEEEQDAFQTEQAMLAAYSEDFPTLVIAKGAAAEREWREGNARFVLVRVTDSDHNEYRATMGFWLSDAGDWQLISCDVKPVSDRIAGL
jgi:hypothetical protein